MKNYNEYLKTEHWQTMRRLVLDEFDYHCAVCYSNDGLDVHHRTYNRLGKERLSDLTVLYRECHGLFHNQLAISQNEQEVSGVRDAIECAFLEILYNYPCYSHNIDEELFLHEGHRRALKAIKHWDSFVVCYSPTYFPELDTLNALLSNPVKSIDRPVSAHTVFRDYLGRLQKLEEFRRRDIRDRLIQDNANTADIAPLLMKFRKEESDVKKTWKIALG